MLKYNNWFMISIALTLSILVGVVGLGILIMEGENPLKLSTTIWYLNDSEQEVLRIAGDNDRYLTYMDKKEEKILEFLPNLNGVKKGEWELKQTDDKQLIFIEKTGKQKLVTIRYKEFLDTYIIFNTP
jgi:hypothetical protein